MVLTEGWSSLVVQSRLSRKSTRKGHTGNSPQWSATFPDLTAVSQSHMVFLYLTALDVVLIQNLSSHSLNFTFTPSLVAQIFTVCLQAVWRTISFGKSKKFEKLTSCGGGLTDTSETGNFSVGWDTNSSFFKEKAALSHRTLSENKALARSPSVTSPFWMRLFPAMHVCESCMSALPSFPLRNWTELFGNTSSSRHNILL